VGLDLLDITAVNGEIGINIIVVVVTLNAVNDIGVESERALGDEGGSQQDDAHNSVHDASDVCEGGTNISLLDLSINHTTEDNSQHGVQDNVEGVQESHDGTQRRDLVIRTFNLGKSSLNVGSQRDITGSPTERDRDPDSSQCPSIRESILLGGIREGQDPNDQETKSIETQPGERGLDLVGEEKHKEGTQKLTKVGTSDHDLGIGTFVQDTLGKCRAQLGLEVTVSEQWNGVTRNEPNELAGREDDLGTAVHGGTEVSEAVTNLGKDGGVAQCSKSLAVLKISVQETNEGPGNAGKDEEEGCHGRGNCVTELENQERGEEGTRGTGNLVEDVDSTIHALQLDNIASDNISGNDTTNQLDHSVADTDDRIDGEENDWVPVTNPLGLAFGKLATSCNVNDDDDSREQAEEKD